MKSVRKFFFIRQKIKKQFLLYGKPSVINQHPSYRNLFFSLFPGLLTDLFFRNIGITCIPAAPAQIAEHFRDPPFLSHPDAFVSGYPRKCFMYRFR